MGLIEDFFSEALLKNNRRIAKSTNACLIRLDKNEMPFDIEDDIKKEILEKVSKEQWNRYPSADNVEIETLIANLAGVAPENIAVGPGSANIIECLLNYFALIHKDIVIVEPSYTLFDYHCKTYNIPYRPWQLNNKLEYDSALMPILDKNSVVIIVSPNNPVGNIISEQMLEELLIKNTNSLFIVDEVYHEFSGYSFNDLFHKYPNLLLLRSFSKTYSSAGLRFGYLIAEKVIAEQIRKLILPFSLNYLTLSFAKIILGSKTIIHSFHKKIEIVLSQRERVFAELEKLSANGMFSVKKSHGNFLLVRFKHSNEHEKLLQMLNDKGIVVLNVTKLPLLENSIRVSIGEPSENDIFLNVVNKLVTGLINQP